MHADGYTGYNELYRGQVTEVACMAHIRRKFCSVNSGRGRTLTMCLTYFPSSQRSITG